jgi:hypothetical protein
MGGHVILLNKKCLLAIKDCVSCRFKFAVILYINSFLANQIIPPMISQKAETCRSRTDLDDILVLTVAFGCIGSIHVLFPLMFQTSSDICGFSGRAMSTLYLMSSDFLDCSPPLPIYYVRGLQ